MPLTSRAAVALYALAAFLSGGRFAEGWNGPGHETIAYLAWQNLTPEAKKGVSEVLRQHPHYAELFEHENVPAGELREMEAFMVAATWPDLVRTPNTPKYKYHRGSWHYADFPFVVGTPAVVPEEPVAALPATQPARRL